MAPQNLATMMILNAVNAFKPGTGTRSLSNKSRWTVAFAASDTAGDFLPGAGEKRISCAAGTFIRPDMLARSYPERSRVTDKGEESERAQISRRSNAEAPTHYRLRESIVCSIYKNAT